ncbi:MAG: UDP-galactopyranose mutase [bacterium]|nr:UDP-galactopyranose mutase [bacterium]
MNKKVVVVGSGLAGSILARKMAEEKNADVFVIEKRNHIAGNVYDQLDTHGIRVQRYGPHTFHTSKDNVRKFIMHYTELIPYKLRCQVNIEGMLTTSPFNFHTIDQLYGEQEARKLKELLLHTYPDKLAYILDLLKSNDLKIRDFAQVLYNKDYRLYTAKQWGIDPEKIDPSILRRVPVILDETDTYFRDRYEGIPKDGFTQFIASLLNHKNICVQLNQDAIPYISFDHKRKKILFKEKEMLVIFTGEVDRLFRYEFGMLPYRSLEFEYQYLRQRSYQDAAIVAYPGKEPYTRITEYTKLPYQQVGEQTIISLEYPYPYDRQGEKGTEPYYPVLTEESKKMYQNYVELAKDYKNLILCGRLADFSYYNMDQVIERALQVADQITTEL